MWNVKGGMEVGMIVHGAKGTTRSVMKTERRHTDENRGFRL
jgi:dihydroxyacetone kinase